MFSRDYQQSRYIQVIAKMLLLTTQQVADQLQVSRTLVTSLVHSGELAAIQIGKRLRFRQEEVQAFVLRQALSPVKPVRRKVSRSNVSAEQVATLKRIGIKV